MSVRRGLLLVGVCLAAALSVFALKVLREFPAPSPADTAASESSATASTPPSLPMPAIAPEAAPVRSQEIDAVAVTAPVGDKNPLLGESRNGVLVHVLDASTRSELEDVTVAPANEHARVRHFPGADGGAPLLTHAPSPVTITPVSVKMIGLSSRARFWIGARDHVWRELDIDFDNPAERSVELGRSATLIVTIEGALPTHDADEAEDVPQLRLRKPDDRSVVDNAAKEAFDRLNDAMPSGSRPARKPSFDEVKRVAERAYARALESPGFLELLREQPAALGETRFEGLDPGSIEALLEVGVSYLSPVVIARASVDLAAGETTQVTLTSRSLIARRRVPLAGTLVLPVGWSTHHPQLRIEPLDLVGRSSKDERLISLTETLAPVGLGATYAFDAGLVLPATYSFGIDEIGFRQSIAIGEAGDKHIALVVPDPALLHLYVVDADSGEAVQIRYVSWSVRADGSKQVFDGELKPDAGGERYSGLVPVGVGVIRFQFPIEWRLEQATPREVCAGEQAMRVRVHRACGVAVAFSCDGVRVSMDGTTLSMVTIELIESGRRGRNRQFSDGGVRLEAPNPGRYRVTFPPIPTYAPIEPIEIDVPEEQFVPLEVALHRR